MDILSNSAFWIGVLLGYVFAGGGVLFCLALVKHGTGHARDDRT